MARLGSLAAAVFGLVGSSSGCGDAKEAGSASAQPTVTAPPPNKSATNATTGSPGTPAELAWDAPKEWEAREAEGAFRKAAYRVPRASGDSEDGELTVVVAGGTVEKNIERWKTQFDLDPKDKEAVKQSERQVKGMTVTIVEIHGTYAGMGGGMPGRPGGPGAHKPKPKADFAMLGAIVPTTPQAYFFKLVGPKATVEAAKPAFDALIASVRP